jgi:hypothetical protein
MLSSNYQSPLGSSIADHSSSVAEITVERKIVALRNGKTAPNVTSLSALATLLTDLGIPGPTRFVKTSVAEVSVKIGEGAQFEVFREAELRPGNKFHTDRVIKRVKIGHLTLKEGPELSENQDYLQRLRFIELEVLSLCRDGLRGNRNIVRLLSWGCTSLTSDASMLSLLTANRRPRRSWIHDGTIHHHGSCTKVILGVPG